jgi:hypothetical protein
MEIAEGNFFGKRILLLTDVCSQPTRVLGPESFAQDDYNIPPKLRHFPSADFGTSR